MFFVIRGSECEATMTDVSNSNEINWVSTPENLTDIVEVLYNTAAITRMSTTRCSLGDIV